MRPDAEVCQACRIDASAGSFPDLQVVTAVQNVTKALFLDCDDLGLYVGSSQRQNNKCECGMTPPMNRHGLVVASQMSVDFGIAALPMKSLVEYGGAYAG
jgi:hypothetical protein